MNELATPDPLLEALLDSWDRNNTILINLLGAIPEDGLDIRALEDSPSIGQLFTHIHFVRLIFVHEDAPEHAGDLPGEEWALERDRARLAEMLRRSAGAVRDAVKGRLEAGRAMELHYDHPILLLQHMLWHEGYHHGQIKLALKAAGQPLTDEEVGPPTWGIWMRKAPASRLGSGPVGAPPGRPCADDIESFLEYFEGVRGRTLRVIEHIPPDRLEWAPAEGRFTFGDLIRHIGAAERYIFTENARREPSRYPGHGRELAEGWDEVRDFLTRMHAEATEILSGLTPEDLRGRSTTPGGTSITTWKWLRAMVEHEIHHRGQIYSMLGILGVPSPPLYGLTEPEVRARSLPLE